MVAKKAKVSEHELDMDTKKLLDKIQAAVKKARNYTPKVGVFGGSGVGKSSLCNALFGKDVAAISDVEACTRAPQEILLGGEDGQGGIVLVDVPGIGEDGARQKEYIELYKSLVPELDLVLWAIKSDDRNYMASEEAYKIVFSGEHIPPVIFVVTQADKTNPIRDWNESANKPGETQQKNILLKERDVSSRFDVSAKNIISVSTEEKFNLTELVSLIVGVLPNEKKFSIAREAIDGIVSEEVEKAAEKGVFDYVKEVAGDAWDVVKEAALVVLVDNAPALAKKAMKWIKSWL